MASVLFDDISFPTELYDPTHYGFSEPIRDLLLFAPKVIELYTSKESKKPLNGTESRKEKPEHKEKVENSSYTAWRETVTKTAVEVAGEYVKYRVRTAEVRERTEDSRTGEGRYTATASAGTRRRTESRESFWAQEWMGSSTERQQEDPIATTKENPKDSKQSTTDGKTSKPDKSPNKTSNAESESESDSTADPKPSSTSSSLTTPLLTSSLTLLTLYTAYRTSTTSSQAIFLTNFRALLNETQSILTSTTHWLQTRQSLNIPTPNFISQDLTQLKTLHSLLEKLDQGPTHDRAFVPAYLTASVSAAIGAAAYGGLINVAAGRWGLVGVVAAGVYGVVMKGWTASGVVRESLDVVARRAERVLVELEREGEGRRAEKIRKAFVVQMEDLDEGEPLMNSQSEDRDRLEEERIKTDKTERREQSKPYRSKTAQASYA